ncbi:unnamed protein product [Microthlaspi erraticum]|uniref:Uncharacterized protein n=1 Tax=Microthlaspi erraticum TaxID=1685480 RepID=A0A6D2HQ08_9BRAS|nr:unnamed protein product [Microthlaspi erraticum]
MTGIMRLSFSKSVETGTGFNGEHMEKANQEEETQPNLDLPESKPPDQQLQGLGVTRKETNKEELPTQVPNPKSAENTFCLIMPKEIRSEPHIQPDPEVEKGTAEQERHLEAHKALTCHTKEEYEQPVLEPIATADSLMSVLHNTQKLEPDGAKHVELEPDGIKDIKLEVEEKLDVMDKLVANHELAAEKKPLAALMQLIVLELVP